MIHFPSQALPFRYHCQAFWLIDTHWIPLSRSFVVFENHQALLISICTDHVARFWILLAILFPWSASVVCWCWLDSVTVTVVFHELKLWELRKALTAWVVIFRIYIKGERVKGERLYIMREIIIRTLGVVCCFSFGMRAFYHNSLQSQKNFTQKGIIRVVLALLKQKNFYLLYLILLI